MPKLTICGGGNAAHVIMALAPNAGWEVDVFAPLAGLPPALTTIDKVITWTQTHLNRQYLHNGMLSGADLPHTRVPQAYGVFDLDKILELQDNRVPG